MSYLEAPRIHFSGQFQADTSTVNNDVRHYSNKDFQPNYQEPMTTGTNDKGETVIEEYNGYWNPEGSGAWRMLNCTITSAVLGDQVFTDPSQDAVVGLTLAGAADRVAAKLVDLDPQQQLVSQIWGLEIRLVESNGNAVLSSEFLVSPFCQLWKRQTEETNWLDQVLAAAYQSMLTGVELQDSFKSPTLEAMREVSLDGLLSIRMNVFGFDRSPGVNDFGTGHVVGTIGPAFANEPNHFTLGRQFTPKMMPPQAPFTSIHKVGYIQAKVCETGSRLSVDLGNALPTQDSHGTLLDIGELSVAILKDANIKLGDSEPADKFNLLGAVSYLQDPEWYSRTAAIVDFALNDEQAHLIGDHPLALVKADGENYKVLNRETAEGMYVRADNFVYRLNPGEEASVQVYASQFGAPLATDINIVNYKGILGLTSIVDPTNPMPPPDVMTPAGILSFPETVTTNDVGCADFTLSACANGPGNPRGYIDGQLYGIQPQFANPPEGLITSGLDFLSILTFDLFEIPDPITWYDHVQPIMQQYANLYPIMSKRLVDLGDYDSVVANLGIIKFSFELPIHNPNHMPVTRDLSENKRKAILAWMTHKGADGKPIKGTPPAQTRSAPASAERLPKPESYGKDLMDFGSKAAGFRNILKKDEAE
jgi:hypothetical protein